MKRIELHLKTGYSYKNFESMIDHSDMEQIAQEVGVLSVVDYCSLSSIPYVEQLKLQFPYLKTIYGVELNLKFDELYVDTILLAKNKKGLENLYSLVSRLNEEDVYFLDANAVMKYRDSLLFGLARFDKNKDYNAVLEDYDYIEILPNYEKEINEQIIKVCKMHELIPVVCSAPVRLKKEDDKINKVLHDVNNAISMITGPNNYYHTTEELRDLLSYLEDVGTLILDNPKKIVDLIEDYSVSFAGSKLESKESLEKKVMEYASYLYVEEIPSDIMAQIKKELEELKENHLDGTLLYLEKIVKDVQRTTGGFININLNLNPSIVMYILGLSLECPTAFSDHLVENDVAYFNIMTSKKMRKMLTQKMQNHLLIKSRFLAMKKASAKISEMNLTEAEKKEIYYRINEIKTGYVYAQSRFLLIPSLTKIRKLMPIHPREMFYASDFSFLFLDQYFVMLIFETDKDLELLQNIQDSTGCKLLDIDFTDDVITNNKYLEYYKKHYQKEFISEKNKIDTDIKN